MISEPNVLSYWELAAEVERLQAENLKLREFAHQAALYGRVSDLAAWYEFIGNNQAPAESKSDRLRSEIANAKAELAAARKECGL